MRGHRIEAPHTQHTATPHTQTRPPVDPDESEFDSTHDGYDDEFVFDSTHDEYDDEYALDLGGY